MGLKKLQALKVFFGIKKHLKINKYNINIMITFNNIYYYIHSFFEFFSFRRKPFSKKSDIESQNDYEEISFFNNNITEI